MPFTLPSFSGTKEIYHESVFRSFVVRWCWRFYTQRLTQAGRWFLWPTLLFTSYGSLSLHLQTFTFFAYAFGLWAGALCGMLLWRPRVFFQARMGERVCAGETLPVEVEVVRQGGPGDAGLSVLPHRLPPHVDAAPDSGVSIPPLGPGERARVQLGLRCSRRGVYRLRGFRVESAFPFGLLRAHQVVAHEQALIVYPKFAPLAQLRLPVGRRLQPGGVALASNVGDSFEYAGNREYRDGDSVRIIDWRATARLNTPIVREYREEYFLRVAVILDTHVPAGKRGILGTQSALVSPEFLRIPRLWGAAAAAAHTGAAESFERAVSICAAVSDYMARQEYLVDIFAAGPNLYHLTAGRSLAYLDQILDILACVEANPAEPFEAIEPELMAHLDCIASVICVFLDWNPARRMFVHKLREQGADAKVIIVRDAPCTLDPGAESGLLGAIPVIDKRAFEEGIEEL